MLAVYPNFFMVKMVVKKRSALQLIFSLTAALCCCCASLPVSDADSQTTPADNTTELSSNNQFLKRESSLKKAVCLSHWDRHVKCTDGNDVFLSIGHCLTYEEGNGVFEFKCPYFELKGHQVSTSKPGYIKLPNNISELNDYMCGPMNRKGFLCEECIDDFSISMTSIGHKCSNCTDVWYGIPLYLTAELVPITALYLLILVFQLHITSAPMTSFILYSQLVIYVLTIDRPSPLEKVVPQCEKSFLCNLNLLLYGLWNLDILRYSLPPFCVTSGLNLRYKAILGYLSLLYPLFLIFLTWVCIELYGRRFKPIVYILKPFRKCLSKLKPDWSETHNTVDLFSAFFLLSYSKLMYQASLFLATGKVSKNDRSIYYTVIYDSSITFGGSKFVAIAVVSVLILVLFNILPALLLVLYPFSKVRACLGAFKLTPLFLKSFLAKFYGCYRDGCHGSRDMRSFAGLYFFLRFLPFSYYPLELYKVPFSFGSYLVLTFLSATLLIAIARPYTKTYMNVFDTLILGHLTFLAKMITDNYYTGMGTHIFLVTLMPAVSLVIYLLYVKVFIVNNFNCMKLIKCCKKGDSIQADEDNSLLESIDRERVSMSQPLLPPTSHSTEIDSYGASNSY